MVFSFWFIFQKTGIGDYKKNQMHACLTLVMTTLILFMLVLLLLHFAYWLPSKPCYGVLFAIWSHALMPSLYFMICLNLRLVKLEKWLGTLRSIWLSHEIDKWIFELQILKKNLKTCFGRTCFNIICYWLGICNIFLNNSWYCTFDMTIDTNKCWWVLLNSSIGHTTNYLCPLDNSFIKCHKSIIYHNNIMGNYFIFITYTLWWRNTIN
jgi:hypothetical protein